jgi:uncharacterized protein YjiS (DUF1127 family)
MTCRGAQSGYMHKYAKHNASTLRRRIRKVATLPIDPQNTAPAMAQGWGLVGQQILNLLDRAAARAAERRALGRLDRTHLDDCGLTPADVAQGLPDLYASDFRVAQIAWRRAA